MPLLEELRRPFNLLSTAIAVVSLVTSVYFYFSTLQKREPVYLIQKSSQIVTSAISSQNFRVVDGKGTPISGDIHLLELVFWNAGRMPIEPTDVRNPVIIVFPPNHKLLEARVIKQTKQTVTDFVLTSLPFDALNGPQLKVTWKHLDPGLGARLQFIYVGEPNPSLKFEGDILDASIEDAVPIARKMFGSFISTLVFAIVGMGSYLFLMRILEKTISRQGAVFAWVLNVLILGGAFLVAGSLNWTLFAIKVAPV